MTDVGVTTASLSERVADELRVALARKRMSAAGLARELGVSQTYIWRRLEGQTAFDLNDLERVARVLGIDIMDLFPREPGGSGTLNRASIEVPRKADPRPVRHLAPRPFGPPRRDRNRPVSAIPATQRRPKSTRPGERAIAV